MLFQVRIQRYLNICDKLKLNWTKIKTTVLILYHTKRLWEYIVLFCNPRNSLWECQNAIEEMFQGVGSCIRLKWRQERVRLSILTALGSFYTNSLWSFRKEREAQSNLFSKTYIYTVFGFALHPKRWCSAKPNTVQLTSIDWNFTDLGWYCVSDYVPKQ